MTRWPDHRVERASFILTGPFLVDWGHGEGKFAQFAHCHGASLTVFNLTEERRHQVHGLSFRRIEMADIVFAHINETDCYGTFVEIGYANAIGRPVFPHFGPRMHKAHLSGA